MNVTGKTRIYRKDFDGRPSYSRKISSQEYKDGQKGDWINTFENVQFPKGANIPDKSDVDIKGFEAVYKTKNGDIKRKSAFSSALRNAFSNVGLYGVPNSQSVCDEDEEESEDE